MADENPVWYIKKDTISMGEAENLVKTILTHTVDYIHTLRNQNAEIMLENEELKKRIADRERVETSIKRHRCNTEEGNESENEYMGPTSTSNYSHQRVHAEITNLKRKLEFERSTRIRVQEQLKELQDQFFVFRRQQIINERVQRMNESRLAARRAQAESDISVPTVSSTQMETQEAQSSTSHLPLPSYSYLLESTTNRRAF